MPDYKRVYMHSHKLASPSQEQHSDSIGRVSRIGPAPQDDGVIGIGISAFLPSALGVLNIQGQLSEPHECSKQA